MANINSWYDGGIVPYFNHPEHYNQVFNGLQQQYGPNLGPGLMNNPIIHPTPPTGNASSPVVYVFNSGQPPSSSLLGPFLYIFTVLIIIFLVITPLVGIITNEASPSNKNTPYEADQKAIEVPQAVQPLEIRKMSDIFLAMKLQDRYENISLISIQELVKSDIAVCAYFDLPDNNPNNHRTNAKVEVYKYGNRINNWVHVFVPKTGTECFRLPRISAPGKYEIQLGVMNHVVSTSLTVSRTAVENIQARSESPQYDAEQEVRQGGKVPKTKRHNQSSNIQEESHTWRDVSNRAIYLNE